MEAKTSVLIVLIAGIVMLGIAANGLMEDEEFPEIVPEVPIDPTPGAEDDGATDDGTLRVGDLVIPDDQGLFTVTCETNPDGTVDYTFTLDESISSKYTGFQWTLQEVGNIWGSDSTGIKEEAEVTWTTYGTEVGEYTMSVICTGKEDQTQIPGFIVGDRYTVSMCIGSVSKVYSWIYDDHEYTLPLEYDYYDFMVYDGTNGASPYTRSAKNDSDYSVVYDFMAVNDVVRDLEDKLEYLYGLTYTTPTKQGYAEFVLAYVQCCFGYSLDSNLYWQDEYFAFPMETIYHGKGDCEDTSILYATLMSIANYDAGVILIPGHAVGAIALDTYIPGDVSPTYTEKVGVFHMQYGGKTYMACETTLDKPDYGVGWLGNDWKIVDGDIIYKGEPVDDTYGFGLYPIKRDPVVA